MAQVEPLILLDEGPLKSMHSVTLEQSLILGSREGLSGATPMPFGEISLRGT